MEHKDSRIVGYAPLFLSGAVIGAVLGVLFAPSSGEETRRNIGGWLKERREKGRMSYQAIREALEKGRKPHHEAATEKKLTHA